MLANGKSKENPLLKTSNLKGSIQSSFPDLYKVPGVLNPCIDVFLRDKSL